jgi:hypothetical protein
MHVRLIDILYLLNRLRSSLPKFYGRHHDLVDTYGMSISNMTKKTPSVIDVLTSTSNTTGDCKKQELLTLLKHLRSHICDIATTKSKSIACSMSSFHHETVAKK